MEKTTDLVGALLKGGRYEVLSRLGGGGMADVYHAIDHDLEDAEVAVKVPKAELLNSPELAQKFQREIRQLIRLRDLPGVVPIYDQGEYGGLPFFVMAYMPGGSLEDRLRQGTQSPDDVLAWLVPMAEALDAVGEAGVVHRDVKPANLLFDARGKPALSDFGIVKALGRTVVGRTATNLRIFTPGFAAPEQIAEGPDAEGIDARADQYALACTAFAALTGHPPFDSADQKLLNPAPSVREFVDAVPEACAVALARGLKRDRSERFASSRELARAYQAGMAPDARAAPTVGPGLTVRTVQSLDARRVLPSGATTHGAIRGSAIQRPRRRRLAWVLAALVFVMIGGVIYLAGDWRPAHSGSTGGRPEEEAPLDDAQAAWRRGDLREADRHLARATESGIPGERVPVALAAAVADWRAPPTIDLQRPLDGSLVEGLEVSVVGRLLTGRKADRLYLDGDPVPVQADGWFETGVVFADAGPARIEFMVRDGDEVRLREAREFSVTE